MRPDGTRTCSHRWALTSRCLTARPVSRLAKKLLRSVFYKGMAAAVVEALEAARAAGYEQWLREHLAAELTAANAGTA